MVDRASHAGRLIFESMLLTFFDVLVEARMGKLCSALVVLQSQVPPTLLRALFRSFLHLRLLHYETCHEDSWRGLMSTALVLWPCLEAGRAKALKDIVEELLSSSSEADADMMRTASLHARSTAP